MYRVRWKNYTSDDDTWEPEAHLEDCREVLLAYKKCLAEARVKREQSGVSGYKYPLSSINCTELHHVLNTMTIQAYMQRPASRRNTAGLVDAVINYHLQIILNYATKYYYILLNTV